MGIGEKEYSWYNSLATDQPGTIFESCLDWPAGPWGIQFFLLIFHYCTYLWDDVSHFSHLEKRMKKPFKKQALESYKCR